MGKSICTKSTLDRYSHAADVVSLQKTCKRRYSPSRLSLDEPVRAYRGMMLLEFSRDFPVSAGVNVRGMSRDEIAKHALHSTSDFAEILSALTNKTLRQAYEACPPNLLGQRGQRDRQTYPIELGRLIIRTKPVQLGDPRIGGEGIRRELQRLPWKFT